MSFNGKKIGFFIAFIFLTAGGITAQKKNFSLLSQSDSLNIYHKMLNDRSDDLMENFPADDIYNNIWTSDHVNPYKVSVASMPDSVLIDCSRFVVPVPGSVTSNFGPRKYRFHYGIDLRLSVGDTVKSSFAGKVRIIEYEPRGYGNYVVIRHDNGLETVYGHLSAVLVNLNQTVKAGEIIAFGGNTGRSTGPHLHYEIRYLGNAINPAHVINFGTGHVWEKNFLLDKRKAFYYKHEASQPVVHASRYYTAKKGDTIAKIAARNGLSAKELSRLNGLSSKSKVKAGQQIRLR